MQMHCKKDVAFLRRQQGELVARPIRMSYQHTKKK
jgi:hypothetical protein